MQIDSDTFIGTVNRIQSGGQSAQVWAIIPELGGKNEEFGPLPLLLTQMESSVERTGGAEPTDPDEYSYDDHDHSIDLAQTLLDLDRGDTVVIARVGHVRENLIVIGRLVVEHGSGTGTSA